MSTQTTTIRTITLTENPDGRWTAYDTATKTVTEGDTRDETLDKLDDAATTGTDEDSNSPAERVGGHGMFAGEKGEAFAAAAEQSRDEFEQDYEEKQDDLFGQ